MFDSGWTLVFDLEPSWAYQAWFCQQLAWNRRALHRTPGNSAPVASSRLTQITCTPAKKTAQRQLVCGTRVPLDRGGGDRSRLRAAGQRHYVASSRGRRRGHLEVRDANVADKSHLILDVATYTHTPLHTMSPWSMSSTVPATTSVAMAALLCCPHNIGALRADGRGATPGIATLFSARRAVAVRSTHAHTQILAAGQLLGSQHFSSPSACSEPQSRAHRRCQA